ncbi:MAG: hypothetical protein Q4P20_11815 [Eubacteriales bacterium]|nr:hypothetical protein [Eubacteriales bacterium]
MGTKKETMMKTLLHGAFFDGIKAADAEKIAAAAQEICSQGLTIEDMFGILCTVS